MDVDVPWRADGHLRPWQRGLVGRRAKFRSDRQLRGSGRTLGSDHAIPPFEVGIQRILPFRSAGVANLGALRMSYTNMKVLH